MGIDTVELSTSKLLRQRIIERIINTPVVLGVTIAGTFVGMQYALEHYQPIEQPRIYISRPFLEGLEMKKPTIKQFFTTYDLNGDGLVDDQEYKRVRAREYDKVRF